jgi:addiction module HigA family antidote
VKRATVTKGSGNIFRDVGFSEERSAELILKSSLLQALQETIRGRGWKQAEAATQLGIDQAKISKLLAGQMAGFSVERLVHFLSLLGQDVEVTVRRAPRGQRYGTVRAKVSRRASTVCSSSIKRTVMIKNGMRPVHPGEILFEEFMKPAEPPINANRLAKALDVPVNRITAIINGRRGITGDTAVRLATLFDTTPEFWMNLQKTYELRLAEQALPGKVRKHIEQHRVVLVSA